LPLDLQVGGCVRDSKFILIKEKNTHKAREQCFTGHGKEFASLVLITEEMEVVE
jgi:hypothetical protein